MLIGKYDNQTKIIYKDADTSVSQVWEFLGFACISCKKIKAS